MPELALHLARLDLQVGDGGLELRVPIDQALVAVEQALAIELHEHLEDGAGEALVHGEAFVLPIHRAAEPTELPLDRAAGLRLPLPDMLQERLTPHLLPV